MKLKKKASKQSSNRQGTKLEYKGIKFKSKLEVYCYKKLEEAGIKVVYEGTTFELLPQIEFIYNDKKTNTILPLTYTPDFIGKNFIIECKGYASMDFPLRWKLFKHYLYNNGFTYQLYKPMSLKQIDIMVEKILKQSRVLAEYPFTPDESYKKN